ncbi:MAG: hypothetical protein LBE58_05030 [Comamonas sp.]|nr:hypothetical protein [Comamonas sp.]
MRAYLVRTALWMGVYCAIHLLVIFGWFDTIIGTPMAWLLALAVAVPIAAQLRASLLWIKAADEYQRAQAIRSVVIACGLLLMLCSIWGFGESYAAAPHVPAWLVVPLFWLVWALVSCTLRLRG